MDEDVPPFTCGFCGRKYKYTIPSLMHNEKKDQFDLACKECVKKNNTNASVFDFPHILPAIYGEELDSLQKEVSGG